MNSSFEFMTCDFMLEELMLFFPRLMPLRMSTEESPCLLPTGASPWALTLSLRSRAVELCAELSALGEPPSWADVTHASVVWFGNVDLFASQVFTERDTSPWLQLLHMTRIGFGPSSGHGLNAFDSGEWQHVELSLPDLDHLPNGRLKVRLNRIRWEAFLRAECTSRRKARLAIPEHLRHLDAATLLAEMTSRLVLKKTWAFE